jgi:hypothetical protein
MGCCVVAAQYHAVAFCLVCATKQKISAFPPLLPAVRVAEIEHLELAARIQTKKTKADES